MQERFFNTVGPCKPNLHYVLPPLARINQDELFSLIAQEKYFILHAPRQTGKTSCLLALRDELNRRGEYACVYANIETAQSARGLEQTWGYADRCGADEAHLVLFDIRSARSWEEKIYHRTGTYQGQTIEVWGM